MPAAPFRFIHTSDLHLGKSFPAFAEDKAARLIEARRQTVPALAQAAMEHGATDILVAGDVFNTTTPHRRTIVQAAQSMCAFDTLRWWIIPGNHDHCAVVEPWHDFHGAAGGNVRVLLEPEAVEVEAGVILLPAPLRHIRSAEDPTLWMDACATPEGALRIGLAHGTVFSFGSTPRPDQINPARAKSARLDYLALGDRHTDCEIGPRTFYSGSPERDRVEDGGRGVCLAVTLVAPGAAPEVVREVVGAVEWRDVELALLPGEDAVAALDDALRGAELPPPDSVVRVRARGAVRLEERQRLALHAARIGDGYLDFKLDEGGLVTELAADDLDAFGPLGTGVRLAADELSAIAGGSGEDAVRAARALDKLYAYVRKVAA